MSNYYKTSLVAHFSCVNRSKYKKWRHFIILTVFPISMKIYLLSLFLRKVIFKGKISVLVIGVVCWSFYINSNWGGFVKLVIGPHLGLARWAAAENLTSTPDSPDSTDSTPFIRGRRLRFHITSVSYFKMFLAGAVLFFSFAVMKCLRSETLIAIKDATGVFHFARRFWSLLYKWEWQLRCYTLPRRIPLITARSWLN